MSELILYTYPVKTTPTTIYEDGGVLTQRDKNYWKDQNTSFSVATSLSMSGYEGFNVKYKSAEGGVIQFDRYRFEDGDGGIRTKKRSNSFITTYDNITMRGVSGSTVRIRSAFVPYVTGYTSNDQVYYLPVEDEYLQTISVSANTISGYLSSSTSQYFSGYSNLTFNFSSVSGISLTLTDSTGLLVSVSAADGTIDYTTGYYYISNGTGWANIADNNLYASYTEVYGDFVTTIADASGTVDVFERWPTARMYASADNDNGETIYSDDRVVYGTEPVTAYFTDYSVARTFPISGWFIDYGDTNTASVSSATASYHPENSIVVHDNMFIHEYVRANTYYATLYNEASTTATRSATITDTLNQDATARVDVYPIRARNNFYLISGESVPSTYTDDSPVSPSSVTTNGGTFISGYAPTLSVTFQESATPVSFPISAYDWNFGDVFRSESTTEVVTASEVQTGFGSGWVTNKTNHYVTYNYIFPGLYNVSLGTRVSADPEYNPAFAYSLSSPVCSRDMLVYVQEIEPQASFGVSNASGGPFGSTVVFDATPMTVYFNASATVAGSYPIGRVIWDFGDGTILTVVSSISDPFPQQVTVSNEYSRTLTTQQSTFNVSFSAFAFNTDTMAQSSTTGLGPLGVTPTSAVSGVDWPTHLLAGSLHDDDELLLVFEGNNRSTFNYVLSVGDS